MTERRLESKNECPWIVSHNHLTDIATQHHSISLRRALKNKTYSYSMPFSLLSRHQVMNVDFFKADPNSQILWERYLDIAHSSTSGPCYQMGNQTTAVVVLGNSITSIDLTIGMWIFPPATGETALPSIDPTVDNLSLPKRLRYFAG